MMPGALVMVHSIKEKKAPNRKKSFAKEPFSQTRNAERAQDEVETQE